MKFKIPEEVLQATKMLGNAHFEAYIVGGCVRDLLLGYKPRDWDITTNATPEEILNIFEDTFYENDFGTVGIKYENASDETLKILEVTPYRLEGKYSDKRRPDSVVFSDKIENDLGRRDFTINAMAYAPQKGILVDLYKGREDLAKRTIRAVGDPNARFSEDALRMLRAVRLSSELGFMIEKETEKAIQKNAKNLGKISKERIRDEFSRILLSGRPMEGLLTAERLGLLDYIAPDLKRGIGVEQNQAHKYDVFEHNLRSLQHAADKNYSLEIRLASLFHDISKPETRRKSPVGIWTFYGHEVVGARLTKKILTELRFPKEMVEKVRNLVRWHMFFADPDKITLSAVRRIIRNIGKDNIWDLMNLRVCDRIGTGRPKEQPFRLRKYKSMVEEALRDPISVGMLKIDGNILVKKFHEKPGPRIGFVLHALLEEVLDNPKKNTAEYMEKRSSELLKLSDKELEKLGKRGREKKEEKEEKEIEKLREKYWVK